MTREAGLQTNLNMIMESMTSLNAGRLVIDSFSAVNMALKESIDIRIMAHLLYRFLKKAHCASILVFDQPWGSNSIGQGICEFVADAITHLQAHIAQDNNLQFRT